MQAPDWSQNFNRYSYALNNPLRYNDVSGKAFGIDDALIIAAFMYYGGMQANFQYAAENGKNGFNPANWNWNSGRTYLGIAQGAMMGAGMAGYPIPFLQVPGMIPNALVQGGIQVAINGIGNLFEGENFFTNWYWSAGMGMVSGAYSGYELAKDKGLNYWWGNKVRYNRTQWSFINSDKPDYVINFKIPEVGSKSANDCVPTSYAETEARIGGDRTYDFFKADSKYVENEGVSMDGKEYINNWKKYFPNSVEASKREINADIFDPAHMMLAEDKGVTYHFHFGKNSSGVQHSDNVRGLEVYTRKPMLNKLLFRQSQYNYTRLDPNKNTILQVFRTSK